VKSTGDIFHPSKFQTTLKLIMLILMTGLLLTDDVDFYAKINPESEPSMNFGRSSI
jgi:hypothetical protein